MLRVKKIYFSYDKSPIIKDISFNVDNGEHLSIIGESGSGKSTLLKLIYGEYDLGKGSITWDEKSILGPKFNLIPGYEFMKYVSQDLDLMPFTSVQENIGKYLWSTYPVKKKRRIKELLELFDLVQYADTKVKLLSGGEKQRVSLARALAIPPKIILLDEPFSHIDSFKKHRLRRRLFNYLKEQNITCLTATHDSEDVLGFADNVLVINKGQIVFHEQPKKLYNNPKNPLVASFFGEYNLINDRFVYAHQLKIIRKSPLKVSVTKSYFKGSHYLIEGLYNNQKVYFNHNEAIEPNTKVYLEIVTD